MVRGKFRLQSITRTNGYAGQHFVFDAVGDDGIPENVRYHKYTPAGQLKITVDNPPAEEQFKLGEDYYLDFTHCPKA